MKNKNRVAPKELDKKTNQRKRSTTKKRREQNENRIATMRFFVAGKRHDDSESLANIIYIKINNTI